MRASLSLPVLGAALTAAQQYAGDVISGSLPTVANAQVNFWRIPNPNGPGHNDNLTLINYENLGTNGQRIVPSNIQRAVIVIHGLLRDPWNYQNDAQNALNVANGNAPYINRDSVSIVSPYFASGSDKNFGYPWDDSQKPGYGSVSNALVWSGSKWSAGADNHYPHNSRHTSSYYVLDQMLKYYDDAEKFPNLKQIVLVGHSMGGQMLQRYAAIGDQLNLTTPVAYWIGNPDSYSWMSTYRPLNIPDCPDYDVYRDGYTNFTEYPMSYGADLVAQGRDAIVANFQSRAINYARALLDQGDHSSTCGANTTGANRNERFFEFIKWWQPTCPNGSGLKCDTVDLINVTHDNGQMYNSEAGQSRIFHDNWDGAGGRAYDYGYPRVQAGDDPYPNPALVNTPGFSNPNVYAGGKTYYGCWTDGPNHLTLDTLLSDAATTTIESCTQGCTDGGYALAGLENGSQCYCGNATRNYAAAVVDMSCRTPCSGNDQEYCGGLSRISLFSNGAPASG